MGVDQKWPGNGVGMDWEQIRNETPFLGMDRTFRNGLVIHHESTRNGGGSVKLWKNWT
jgi:hypothetical protein